MTGTTSGKTAKRGKTPTSAGHATRPSLLSGGNPQIPKGEGDAPVQAYIAAMPGWSGMSGTASTR